MLVGVYGIAYLLAAQNPFRLWPIVLVGWIGKILGPLGFLSSALNGHLPWSWGLAIVANDHIKATELGTVFIRNVAMTFDVYLKKLKRDKPVFSRTV